MRGVLTTRRVAVALAAVAGAGAALGVAACGGGDAVPSTITTDLGGPVTQVSSPSTTTSASTPSTPSTSTPAATTTAGAGTTSTGTGATTTAATQPTRVPAVFTLKGGKLTPSTVSVPAFLEAEVTVSSTDGRAHMVKVQAGKGYTFTVPPKGSGTTKVPGQKAGKYQVLVDGKSAGTISWGGEPGP
jgi:hypothetical protein